MKDNMKANYAVVYKEGATFKDEGIAYAEQLELNDPTVKKFTKQEYNDKYAGSSRAQYGRTKKNQIKAKEMVVMSERLQQNDDALQSQLSGIDQY